MAAEIRRARDEEQRAAALALREAVFCGEQGVTLAGELDALDDEALHIVAVADGVAGTCRLLIEPGGTAKFGRLCVRDSERAGYTPYGERFDEEGIEHQGMEKHLP